MERRALLVGVPAPGLNVSLALERVTAALAGLGFGSVDVCTGSQASRDGILEGLDRLCSASASGDAALLYYFGHGGRVRFPELPSPQDERVHGYLSCHRRSRGAFEAVLDHELSVRLSALDARCGNVSVILDCCFSGELVRARSRAPTDLREAPVTDWVRRALAPATDGLLAIDSHPDIVRLCGASPKRQAYARERSGRHIGRLTEALLAVLDEAGEDWPRLCWATVGLRVREQVIDALQMEGQWVCLAGPRQRRLFSRDTVTMPGAVPYLPGDQPGHGWLRAGWVQGACEGDRWSLVSTMVDAEGQPQVLAEAVVTRVDRSRSEVALEGEGAAAIAGGTAAVLRRSTRAMTVAAPQHLHEAIEGSPWLRLSDGSKAEATIVHSEVLELVDASPSTPLRLTTDAQGIATAVAVLEDRARLRALRAGLESHEPSRCPLAFTWQRIDDPEPLPAHGARLTTDDRIRIDLRYEGKAPQPWFVSVILVDPAGRLHLLSTRMPEGLELGPGDHETLGLRPGRPTQGLTLPWPAYLGAAEAPASLWFLASRRPQCLEHLVRARSLDDDAALAIQGLAAETLRARPPERAKGAAWTTFDFTVVRAG